MNLIPSPWTVQLKCLFSVTNYFCLIPIKAALQFHWLLSQVCVTWPFLSREGLLTWEGGVFSRERVGSPHVRGWVFSRERVGSSQGEGGVFSRERVGSSHGEGGVSSRERVGSPHVRGWDWVTRLTIYIFMYTILHHLVDMSLDEQENIFVWRYSLNKLCIVYEYCRLVGDKQRRSTLHAPIHKGSNLGIGLRRLAGSSVTTYRSSSQPEPDQNSTG